jgi:hypothetical protein
MDDQPIAPFTSDDYIARMSRAAAQVPRPGSPDSPSHPALTWSGHSCQGMCFSIEPGIYPDRRFGVRIEVTVTPPAEGGLNKTTHELLAVSSRRLSSDIRRRR